MLSNLFQDNEGNMAFYFSTIKYYYYVLCFLLFHLISFITLIAMFLESYCTVIATSCTIDFKFIIMNKITWTFLAFKEYPAKLWELPSNSKKDFLVQSHQMMWQLKIMNCSTLRLLNAIANLKHETWIIFALNLNSKVTAQIITRFYNYLCNAVIFLNQDTPFKAMLN